MAGIYTDQPVALEVAEILRADRHHVVTTRDLGREGATDDAQLLTAAQLGLVLLTHDIADYVLLHDAWRRWSTAGGVVPRHAGILITPQRWPPSQIADEVNRFLNTGPVLSNELYRWLPGTGWTRRP